jgi:hypothetical protein
VEAILDYKLVLVALTWKLWWPLVRILWHAADPYPSRRANRWDRNDDRPDLEPLVSEEWAAWRLRRSLARRGEEPPPLRARPDGGPGGIRTPLRRLDAGAARRVG